MKSERTRTLDTKQNEISLVDAALCLSPSPSPLLPRIVVAINAINSVYATTLAESQCSSACSQNMYCNKNRFRTIKRAKVLSGKRRRDMKAQKNELIKSHRCPSGEWHCSVGEHSRARRTATLHRTPFLSFRITQ